MQARKIDNPKLYALVPAYNEDDLIEDFIKALDKKLAEHTNNHQIIVVDDGSSDDTGKKVQDLAKLYPVTFVSFSRNFGKEAAITAGIQLAKTADALIILDADFQHPLAIIDLFIEKWQEGYDNVYGIRTRSDQSRTRRMLSKQFYSLNKKIMNIDLPANAGDFRLLDKQVITAINCLPESNRFMKGLYAWVGFKGCPVSYTVAPRAGNGDSKWSYRKLLELAITGITGFSNIPLRLVSLAGFIISFIAILYGLFIILDHLLLGNETPGWATLAAGMMLLGGIQLISLGVVGEYISRIFDEVKRRPTYIINKDESCIYSPDDKNKDK